MWWCKLVRWEMSAPRIILASLPSFCQKLSKLVEICTVFFEIRCSVFCRVLIGRPITCVSCMAISHHVPATSITTGYKIWVVATYKLIHLVWCSLMGCYAWLGLCIVYMEHLSWTRRKRYQWCIAGVTPCQVWLCPLDLKLWTCGKLLLLFLTFHVFWFFKIIPLVL